MGSKRVLDLIFSFFLLALAVWVMVESYHLTIGSLHEPGPGFLTFYGSLIMGLLVGIHIVNRLLMAGKKVIAFSSPANLRVLIYALAITFLAALSFEPVGFVLTAALYMICLLKMVGRVEWVKTLWISAFIILFSYVIFVLFLKVQLPPGLLKM